MIIQPKFRGFICTTAHPVGCEYNVKEQIEYVKSLEFSQGPKNVLVIGASTGYGLASRITAAFGYKAGTIGVFFEKQASAPKKTASAGWYNSAAFEKSAHAEGLYAKSVNGDAFSNEIKNQVAELIKKDLGKVDLVIYSLAAPRRVDPVTGEVYNSVLKPIGRDYASKTVDFHTGEVTDITIERAAGEEIKNTVAVMGGDDWKLWMETLKSQNLLADNVITLAYSYVGPELTHPIYRDGTIGKAKDDLEAAAGEITGSLKEIGGKAYVSINKAVVTQASSAIPVVPLYVSILFKVMKNKGIHEGCIEQMSRLLKNLYEGNLLLDDKGRIRIDDLEMRDDVQEEVSRAWNMVNSDNIKDISDLEGYRNEFFQLFGFSINGVDYEKDIEIEIGIPSIES
ncbi:MAG TPA: trans-2-enoyl-CoA reductase family protein [Clostridiaceae bacterium]|nr:trans-2-enoyl-CoA reductase family protein [Clostridiaceae bacterium]